MLTLDLTNAPWLSPRRWRGGGVLAWERIGDADGSPIDPSPDAIDALLDIWPIFEAFQLSYVSKGLLLEQEKRLRALAEWSFGGGERYCQACAQACPDCPARLNRPETPEGWQVWDLVGRLGGQLCSAAGRGDRLGHVGCTRAR